MKTELWNKYPKIKKKQYKGFLDTKDIAKYVQNILDDIKEYKDRNQGLINELGKAKLVLAAEKQFETEDGELKKANKALNKYNKRLKNDIVNLQKQVAYFHGTPVENPFGDKDE